MIALGIANFVLAGITGHVVHTRCEGKTAQAGWGLTILFLANSVVLIL